MNGDSADKSVKKQRVWKKDMLRTDDFSKMKDMISKLRKHRVNEANATRIPAISDASSGQANAASKGGKSIPARTSIQQT